MSPQLFNFKKALSIFGHSSEEMSDSQISMDNLPGFARSQSDNRPLKSWSLSELPQVGKQIGFMKKPERTVVAAVFVTKGGVLKSSLSLNLARMAALNGLNTCVIGLDMQADISTSLSEESSIDDSVSLADAMARMNEVRGLADYYTGDATLEEIVKPTDIPTLFYIPETPELVALDQGLINRNRREYWLSEQVIARLRHRFDLIVLDCSPNWNRLITNALVSCDLLISPLECKINNFRNLAAFRVLIDDFKREMDMKFKQVFVPSRMAAGRKLSQEILGWYQSNLPQCMSTAIRESAQGEESVAMRVSVPEYAPTSAAANEMRQLLKEIWKVATEQTSVNQSSEYEIPITSQVESHQELACL
jgi:chromosome partitioning protein